MFFSTLRPWYHGIEDAPLRAGHGAESLQTLRRGRRGIRAAEPGEELNKCVISFCVILWVVAKSHKPPISDG